MLPALAVQPVPVSLFGAPVGPQAASPAPAPTSSFAASSTGSGQSESAIGAISGLSGALSSAPVSSASAPSAPFADLLTEAVGRVEQYESTAKTAIEGMMTGKGVDVHQAMIATEKAESGFELVLAVRNKALAAYQQVVGMQF
ncbi:MAG TPA: flagellar hook-basal body complex protein FliE [Acidobacteriaceae bacterium]|nr:flagellar hook-basal body complex protein FliE [Acidobacteriaceae bacterium]